MLQDEYVLPGLLGDLRGQKPNRVPNVRRPRHKAAAGGPIVACSVCARKGRIGDDDLIVTATGTICCLGKCHESLWK